MSHARSRFVGAVEVSRRIQVEMEHQLELLLLIRPPMAHGQRQRDTAEEREQRVKEMMARASDLRDRAQANPADSSADTQRPETSSDPQKRP